MNVMFLGIGSKVYKYDLVSKELMFEFRTTQTGKGIHAAQTQMQLYDQDDKLLCADE